jgi:pilus assembly protein Flp/PilA
LRERRVGQLGATAIEYALVAGLISIVAIAALSSMSVSLNNAMTTVNNKVAVVK